MKNNQHEICVASVVLETDSECIKTGHSVPVLGGLLDEFKKNRGPGESGGNHVLDILGGNNSF